MLKLRFHRFSSRSFLLLRTYVRWVLPSLLPLLSLLVVADVLDCEPGSLDAGGYVPASLVGREQPNSFVIFSLSIESQQ